MRAGVGGLWGLGLLGTFFEVLYDLVVRKFVLIVAGVGVGFSFLFGLDLSGIGVVLAYSAAGLALVGV